MYPSTLKITNPAMKLVKQLMELVINASWKILQKWFLHLIERGVLLHSMDLISPYHGPYIPRPWTLYLPTLDLISPQP